MSAGTFYPAHARGRGPSNRQAARSYYKALQHACAVPRDLRRLRVARALVHLALTHCHLLRIAVYIIAS